MSAIPPSPRIPGFRRPLGRRTPAQLVAVASSLRLGYHVLHLHCTNGLRHLLCSRFPEGYCSDYLSRIKDIWCHRPYLLKRYYLLETLTDSLSTSFSSCSSFFSGKESRNKFIDKGKFHIETSEGSCFNGRPWTNVLLALNVLVYVAQIATQGKLLLWGAKVNSLIDQGQFWRFMTSSLLHANIGHLMVNCYSLDCIGPTVEQLSGPRRFLAIYFTSAIASSVMSYQFCKSPAVGASGAIFGLVGSFSVFVLRHRSIFGGGKQHMQHIARAIALNMVIGLLCRGIDNWGHLGGFLGGAAVSWFLGPAWRCEYHTDDGRSVYVDKAPIFHFISRSRLH